MIEMVETSNANCYLNINVSSTQVDKKGNHVKPFRCTIA